MEGIVRHVPHRPQSARALPMVLASFASFGERELVGWLRTPARCWRRARACRIGISTFAPYWMSFSQSSQWDGSKLPHGFLP